MIQLTFVYVYACSAVHSALLVGFDKAKITGLALNSDILAKISGVNAPAMAAAPINIVGLIWSTASASVSTGSCSWAKCALCSLMPPFGRFFTIRPLLSTNHTRCDASSWLSPSLTMAITQRPAMPRAASPAPWNRMRLSRNLVLVAFKEANTPAKATEAVPYTSAHHSEHIETQLFCT